MYSDFATADPMLFFSTAAGPDAADLYGPPQSALDLYADGTPMAAAQTAIANSVGGSGGAPWYARADVHALALCIIGAVMVHYHLES
jgi:hypothetical protein